jgi:hypothetical protein
VGIGEIFPAQRLEVTEGSIQIRNSTQASTENFVYPFGLTFRATNQVNQDRGTIASIRPFLNGNDNNFGLSFQTQATTGLGVTEKMRISPAGNVGIGTSSPGEKLEISNGNIRVVAGNANIQLRDPGNGDSLQVFTNTNVQGLYTTNSVPLTFSTAGSEKMRINSNGFVGIGTNNPTNGYLHVISRASSHPAGKYFNNATNGIFDTGASSGNFISVYGDSYMWASAGFIAASDSRIKTNFQDIPDGESLQQLRLIEPTSYQYVDKAERGDKRVYGFMAQQVREIIPHAVSLQKHIVPDIYDLADVSGTTVTLRTKTFAYSDVSATVNMILQETGKQDVSANFYPPNTIELHQPFQQDVSEAFVYGRKVDDFHTLDKDVIFTINVAATQELDRQVQLLQQRITMLENERNTPQ